MSRKKIKKQTASKKNHIPEPSMQSFSPAERNRMEAKAYQQQKNNPQPSRAKRSPQSKSMPTQKQSRAFPVVSGGRKSSANPKIRRQIEDTARFENALRHERKRRKNYSLYIICLLFLVAVSGVTLSLTVFFNLTEIVILGSDKHTASEVSIITDVQNGDNLLRLNNNKIAKKLLETWIDVDTVQVRGKYPKTLEIRCQEAEPAWLFASENAYHVISRAGRFIKTLESREGLLSLLLVQGISLNEKRLGDFVVDDSNYQTMVRAKEAFETTAIEGLQGLYVEANDLRLNLDHRIMIKIGDVSELEYKMMMLKQIYETQIGENRYGVLDVSQVGKGFFQHMTRQEIDEEFARLIENRTNFDDGASDAQEQEVSDAQAMSEQRTDTSDGETSAEESTQ